MSFRSARLYMWKFIRLGILNSSIWVSQLLSSSSNFRVRVINCARLKCCGRIRTTKKKHDMLCKRMFVFEWMLAHLLSKKLGFIQSLAMQSFRHLRCSVLSKMLNIVCFQRIINGRGYIWGQCSHLKETQNFDKKNRLSKYS